MADFVAVIRKAVDGLTDNTPSMRELVYEKARDAVLRQLENMNPRPPAAMFERQITKLENAFLQVEQENANSGSPDSPFQELDALYGDSPSAVQEPETEAGLTFELADGGTLRIAHSGQPSDAESRAVETLRLGLLTAAEDLVALASGSNSYSHIGAIAQRYRKSLGSGEQDMSIDLMYVEGIRLENARRKLQETFDNDLPLGSLPVAEALDSVIALNGPTLMSTERGRELVRLGNAYSIRPEAETLYRELAVEFAHRLSIDGRIVDRGDARQLVEINEEIATPSNLNRSTQIAHAANANLLATIARLIVGGMTLGISAVGVQGLLDSTTGATATGELAAFIDRAIPFLLSNRGLLLDLSSAVGNNLNWVNSFLRWLEVQRIEWELRNSTPD